MQKNIDSDLINKDILDKVVIESLIPHAGLMCLNDAVLSWDEKSILCLTQSHLSIDNPLRKDNRLSAVHAIEYCAQAMAVHGGLLAREQGAELGSGYLAAVRNVKLSYSYLDELENDLYVSATQLMAQGGNLMYEFLMYFKSDETDYTVATGRATVIQMAEEA